MNLVESIFFLFSRLFLQTVSLFHAIVTAGLLFAFRLSIICFKLFLLNGFRVFFDRVRIGNS
ncbi:MAG: hypothetical protein C4527_01850 [Candidatus Omnitrophota bacterium]|nr:MAG: hypothetical protein C4527_01850 [Candidatus Omnitrophota bacterium]